MAVGDISAEVEAVGKGGVGVAVGVIAAVGVGVGVWVIDGDTGTAEGVALFWFSKRFCITDVLLVVVIWSTAIAVQL